MPHTPAWHVASACVGVGHVVPHAPQCPGSVARIVSQPFAAFASQSPRPSSHFATMQPFEQPGVPPFTEQTLPHAVQLFGSVVRSASQPSFASALQSA